MSPWSSIAPPDAAAAAESERRRRALPLPALGQLGPAVDRIVAARGEAAGPDDRIEPTQPALMVFAGDHGVAYAKVTAFPPGTTARRINDLGAGRGPVAALAKAASIQVRAWDIAVRGDVDETVVDRSHRVRTASGRIDMQSALRDDEIDKSLAAGVAIADEAVDEGADLLIGAVCGAAVSTPVAALVSALTGTEPAVATTRGAGIDDDMWIAKCAAVRDARFLARSHLGDPRALLQSLGGPDLAALTAFIAQAAARKVPVLVDDAASLVCALLAQRLSPGVVDYVTVANTTMDRTEILLHRQLGLAPLADHRLTLGSGAGALIVAPALRGAMAALDAVADGSAAAERNDHAIDAWDKQLL